MPHFFCSKSHLVRQRLTEDRINSRPQNNVLKLVYSPWTAHNILHQKKTYQYQFGDFSRFNGTTQNIKKNVFCVTAYNQPYNSPLQICIAKRMHCSKKKSATCSFQIGTKKFIVEPSFFISWTITSEKCTQAHVQENRSTYIIYIPLYMKTFLKTGVDRYIFSI